MWQWYIGSPKGKGLAMQLTENIKFCQKKTDGNAEGEKDMKEVEQILVGSRKIQDRLELGTGQKSSLTSCQQNNEPYRMRNDKLQT